MRGDPDLAGVQPGRQEGQVRGADEEAGGDYVQDFTAKGNT